MGISQLVIGVVIIAIGTSLPELVTSVIAIRKKQMDYDKNNVFAKILRGEITCEKVTLSKNIILEIFGNNIILEILGNKSRLFKKLRGGLRECPLFGIARL